MNKIDVFIIFIFVPILSVFPHGGRTISKGLEIGCHQDKKKGNFHCHSKSKFNGKVYKSKEDFINTLSMARKSPIARYKRSLFGAWQDQDKDCQNTRHEILISRSLKPVSFKDKKQCYVKAGEWKDFYYDETLKKASDIDIDHVVPLKYAFDHGADKWDKNKRFEFANDKDNLVITNLKYNRQKGSKGITEWMPIDRNYSCKYAKRWFLIKQRYNLKTTKKEHDFKELLKCN